MQYLVNATFLINSAKSDFSFIEDLDLATIQPVLDQVALEVGMRVEIILDIDVVGLKNKKKKLQIPKNKLMILSPVDRKLLEAAFERKKSVLLVSDDRQIMRVSRRNKIKCYSTPQFIAHLVKTTEVKNKDGQEFLKKLRSIYVRKDDIDAVMKRLKKWM